MQRVGAYEVLYELKSGGMGSVLLGRRRGPGRFEKLVAIKVIRADLAAAERVRAMFLDEAALLARLGHPAVATVHDFGEEANNLYLVMEYVAGVSLHPVIELRPPPHIAARILAEACRGLHAAHELRDVHGQLLGVVHRDISPDNVLLGFDGHVKVIDFGIALTRGRQAPVTEMGMLKGKPPYMSPEQLKNQAVDRRSDVFALGAVLWELLVGEPLFQGESIYAIARAVEHQLIEPPSARVAALPPGLDAIVLEALHRDRDARLPSAAEMAARLDEVVAADGGESLPQWSERMLAPQRDIHRRWLAQILGGESEPAPMGRATGAVTALAMVPGPSVPPPQALGNAPTHNATPIGMEPPRTGSQGRSDREHPGPISTRPLPRSRRRFLLLLSVALIAAAAGSRRWTRSPATRLSVDAVAAGGDAVAAGGDAGGLIEPAVLTPLPGPGPADRDGPDHRDGGFAPVDAGGASAMPAAPRDGARVRKPRPDARTLPDAAPAPDRTVVAAVATAAAAQPPGRLRVVAEPFAYVAVDGQSLGPTPVLSHSLPAGRHVVTLTDPVSGQVRLRKTIDVPSGGMVRVELP